MSEERFDRLEGMMVDMLRIVGNTNSAVEELRGEVKELRQDVDILKQDVQELKEDVSVLKQDVQGLKEDVSVLKQDVQELKEDVAGLNGKMDRLEETVEKNHQEMLSLVDLLSAKSMRHEAAIKSINPLSITIKNNP